MIVLLMGVSGSGKTAVGESLAVRTSWPFVDGDDLHPPANIEKMSAGEPLDDEDRRPWLVAIRDVIRNHEEAGTSVIVACSALKARYRRFLLRGAKDVRLVYLEGSPGLIEQRMQQRQGHFFNARLLVSQFAALEEPVEAVAVSVEGDLESVTSSVAVELGLDPGSRLQKE